MLPLLCYNFVMKKVSKNELINLLNNKKMSYEKLASLTGYHPKSLIRINKQLKNGDYLKKKEKKDLLKKTIIKSYINSPDISYKSFYIHHPHFNISYSYLCQILKSIKIPKEMVIIQKIKKKKAFFTIKDYQTNSLLFKYPSLKNDQKSLKKILFNLLVNYGAPQNICFINCNSSQIDNILKNYHIKRITPKAIYHNSKEESHPFNGAYQKVKIKKEDFYNSITRKTIAPNLIQFNNVRYIINSALIIPKNKVVLLYYNDAKTDLFIKYQKHNYPLTIQKQVVSLKGHSKYNY